VLLIALIAACAPAPSGATACLTERDCAPGEQCNSGRCVAVARDAGGADTRRDDAGATDAAGPDAARLDEDAALADGGSETDAAPSDAASRVDAGPMPGESCSDPIRLELVGGSAHFDGVLGDYGADHDTFCGETGAPDVVFVIDIGPGVHDVDLVTGPRDTDSMIGISDACDVFYDCDDDRSDSDHGARMVLHRYPGTRVFVMVKGYDPGDVGRFTLDVTVSDTTRAGSTCASPIDLGGGAKVVAWPVSTASTLAASCGDSDALIDVYRLGPEPDGTIAEVSGYFGDEPRAVAVVSSCTAPTGESWCEAATNTSGSYWQVFQNDVPAAGAGDQFVTIVGGAVPGTSAYSLDVAP
jgi:hypothetical protein